MLPEQVDEMLKNYKAYAGRCAHLVIAIDLAERELAEMRTMAAEDIAYHVQQYDTMGMPRGTDVGKPTEDAALRLAAGYETDDMLVKLEEIDAMQWEYKRKMLTVHFVEAWLKGLTEKERWLIMEQIINRKFWREIACGWAGRFGEPISKERVRKMKGAILEKIYEMAC